MGVAMTEGKGETNGTMDPPARLAAAKDQLNLVLGFFSRVDTKLSVILGVDLGMLGLLLTKAPNNLDQLTNAGCIGGLLFAAAMIVSLLYLYRGSFPNVNGEDHSIVFFRDIAKMDKTKFVSDFSNLSAESLANSMLRQAWRNSVILNEKFN
jgi:hypothetical protein